MARTESGERVVLGRDGEFLLTDRTELSSVLAAGAVDDILAHASPVDPEDLDLSCAVGRPGKVICVGHNFKQHILEMGHGLPDHPNVFSKFAEALIGPEDAVILDPLATSWDWEAELALVIGREAR